MLVQDSANVTKAAAMNFIKQPRTKFPEVVSLFCKIQEDLQPGK